MKHILLFLFLCSTASLFSQIEFDKTTYDFGRIFEDDIRFVDVYLKNKTGQKAYILSVQTPLDIDCLQSSDLILPDSSVVLRFQVNKRSRGNFSYSIPVYTSDQKTPQLIALKGRIEEAPAMNNFTACPSFEQVPMEGNPLDFLLTLETVDKETGKSIPGVEIGMLQNGIPIGKWRSVEEGLKLKIPLGITYFYTLHPEYNTVEKGMYVNFQNNHVVLELIRKTENVAVHIEPNVFIEEKEIAIENSIPPEREIVIEEGLTKIDKIDDPVQQKREESTIQEFEKRIPTFEELDINNFKEAYFEPIQVVFVVDVSYSMNRYDRLELLKYALGQLVEMLRPQDKMSLVAYASKAFVILPSTSGNQKEAVLEEVRRLKPSGQTAGGAGIKLGYKELRKHLIKDGKNHLIVITDGAFNKDSGNYKKFIKKNLKNKDITMSVVGLQSNEKAEESMREAATLGDGRFILIQGMADAQTKLKQEIRYSSFKYSHRDP